MYTHIYMSNLGARLEVGDPVEERLSIPLVLFPELLQIRPHLVVPVFEGHRLLHHSTLGLRVIKKKKKIVPVVSRKVPCWCR